MTRTLLALVALGLLVAADDPKPADEEAVKKELAKFQGEWKTESIVQDGESVIPEEELKNLRLAITGDRRVLKVGDEMKSDATFTLDPSASPKRITIAVSAGALKGKKLNGIYEVTDDTHTICLNLKGDDWPRELASKPGSGHLLQKFARVKK
jgi:uncharacterized protein (TIGR03067 family)